MRRGFAVLAGLIAAALAACSEPESDVQVVEEIAAPAETAVAEVGTDLPRKLEREGFAVMIADAGPVYIAGQPTEQALEEMRGEGVTKVINLRTEAEMSNPDMVPFDEASKINELGMKYVQIPQGPEDTLTPAALDAFAEAMANADGKVLVHCGSGVRASHMWAAYLVREKGMSIEDALEEAEAMNLKSEEPVRALLGMAD